jgi:phage recombination protein Bet
MTTELARQIDFSEEQKQMIMKTYAQGSSPAEFAVMMETAKVRNLNPLTKQIWFVKVGGKWTYQVSIDGFRAIAQRSGLYAGQDEAVYSYDDKGNILSCSVAVYRKDWIRPCVGTAFFKEFSTGQNLWHSKPHVMISKVAESIALRKAFSEEMSGLYGEGELDQSLVEPKKLTRIEKVAPPALREPSSPSAEHLLVMTPPSSRPDSDGGDSNPFHNEPEWDNESREQRAATAEQLWQQMKVPSGKAKGQFLEAQPVDYLTQLRGHLQAHIDGGGNKTMKDLQMIEACTYWINLKATTDDFAPDEVEKARNEVSK